ncbi:MAG TPA: hypothetical protein VIL74_24455 [Pyrinomonadaceae bacterium]|jgi:hypothetical protein
MKTERIFHISEEGDIETFKPRPAPSAFDNISGDVVFGISGKLLHNYLLPRDCPRVTYYAAEKTSAADRDKFLQTSAEYVVAIEAARLSAVQKTPLFCYEFDAAPFSLIDECAGYYVSYEAVTPISVRRIGDILAELLGRGNVELRITPELWTLADRVAASSLNFSIIRMRHALPRPD